MKIHFSWTISPNAIMELESEMLVRSTKGLDCHCTIWVPDYQLSQISTRLKRIAEVLPYTADPSFVEPWVITPKWDIEPKGDVVIGLDADVMIWNKDLVIQYAEQCLKDNCVCGTIAYGEPFDTTHWMKLFQKYGITDSFQYRYNDNHKPVPFYINNGVVMMPTSILPTFRQHFKKWLVELNKEYKNLYFIAQVANTLALKESQLPVKELPKTFNYLEYHDMNLTDINDVAFLHYNQSRDQLAGGVEAVESLIIKRRMRELTRSVTLL